MTDPSLRFTEQDFSEVKENLRSFFEGQDYFTDYDFEGTGLDIIMSLLAYNTMYNTMNANLMASEMSLGSSNLRSTGVARAKMLGYTPRSITAAKTLANITAVESGTALPDTLTIDKATRFSATDDNGEKVDFVTLKAYSITPDDGEDYVFENVELAQGSYGVIDFIKRSDDVTQRFILPSDKIDTSLLEVYVQEGTDAGILTKYTESTDVLDDSSEATVFYIEESDDGRFELLFGDGVIGKAVADGKVIRAIYFVTSGTEGNGYNEFAFVRTPTSNDINTAAVSVTPLYRSTGGDDPESLETVKFRAPRNFITRNRAVTSRDYASIILNKFADVKSVAVWGGEDNEPPFGSFGKVFISLNPQDNLILTEARKEEIRSTLESEHAVVTIVPEIVDPTFVYVNLNVVATISATQSLLDTGLLRDSIKATILDFSAKQLEAFDTDFEHSKIVRAIDDVDPGIENNETLVTIQGRHTPNINVLEPFAVVFDNAIKSGTLFSTSFTWQNQDAQFDDDGDGNLRIVVLTSSGKIVKNSKAGTINYVTGSINVDPIIIQKANLFTFDIRFTAQPVSNNIIARRNRIVLINPNSLKVIVKVANR